MSSAVRRERVLIIDDHREVARALERALRRAGYSVCVARRGAAGVTQAFEEQRAAVILDLRLPDISGIEVARALRPIVPPTALFILSGFLDVPTTVELMRLGASEVLQKPARLEALVAAVDRVVRSSEHDQPKRESAVSSMPTPAQVQNPPVVYERIVTALIRACDAPRDLKTVGDWADFLGMSYSSLSELCALAGLSARHARDFARVLRAVVQAERQRCQFEMLLDVADRRTLQHLAESAGLRLGVAPAPNAVTALFRTQQFIDQRHPVLRSLEDRLRLPLA